MSEDDADRRQGGAASGWDLKLVGGRFCLDFANTIGGRGGPTPSEFIYCYDDLVTWAEFIGEIAPDEARALRAEASEQPGVAMETYERATALREAIYRIFSAIARDDSPAAPDLDLIRRVYAEAVEKARFVVTERGLRWGWVGDAARDPARVLWPVARSAVDLLSSVELARLRECPGGHGPCNWLFLDRTKNASRRWCSMAECGSQVKARRQTVRRRHARSGDVPMPSSDQSPADRP